jgi:hypothetical protein
MILGGKEGAKLTFSLPENMTACRLLLWLECFGYLDIAPVCSGPFYFAAVGFGPKSQ